QYLKNISRALLHKTPIYRRGVKPPAYLIYGGTHSAYRDPFFEPSAIIWAHSYDYDRYLEVEQEQSGLTQNNWAVFLDHGTPYHPDRYSEGLRFPPEEKYYPVLNRYFDRIEKETGLDVVIAANPRWAFEGKQNPFNGRKIFRGTPEGVRQSKLVIGINSSALGYAIIYRKPVFFLTTELHYSVSVEAAARSFGKHVHPSPEDPIDWTFEMTIDDEIYDEYMEKYIKRKGTPGVYVYQQLCDVLKAGGHV
ncbi:MAG: hypothetical protein KC713_06165, partial [Candidatus Omnitrophica bacterium]|nr:hypothetical protein [Candidatus Omnitrophota bacterium]